jgi:hypothetical protein
MFTEETLRDFSVEALWQLMIQRLEQLRILESEKIQAGRMDLKEEIKLLQRLVFEKRTGDAPSADGGLK